MPRKTGEHAHKPAGEARAEVCKIVKHLAEDRFSAAFLGDAFTEQVRVIYTRKCAPTLGKTKGMSHTLGGWMGGK
jgi:hypothetical protein